MALYNNGFPVNYQYYQQYPGQYQQGVPVNGQYQQNLQPNLQQNMQNLQPNLQQVANQQIQNGGFIPVASEAEARNYPVAPGNSVTFKDEKLPYVYTKTMGFSQLDRPVFEKFRLVKEQEAPQEASESILSGSAIADDKLTAYAQKDDLKPITDDIESLKKDYEASKLNMENLESDIEDLRAKIAGIFKLERGHNERKSTRANG